MPQQKECVFCKIIDGEIDATVLHETTDYICFLDKFPVNEGHALVAPKTHIEDLDQADWNSLFKFIQQTHTEVEERYNPDATNIGVNNGEEAGQTILHLHWHIIPRYEGDLEDPRGGVRGVIPEKRIYRD
jgi:diadenosine tetraphosphate (Ap4A) HIT family hydrolase